MKLNAEEQYFSNKLYGMKLLETIELKGMFFTRLPGGWRVRYSSKNGVIFVPYSDEFKQESNNEKND